MRNKILGAIGVIWGGGILVSHVVQGGPKGTGSYAMGEYGALAFAVCIVIAGTLALLKRSDATAR
jgi:hypothetical protein